MSTQRRNTKRTLRVLLIAGGILVLALIAAVIYFYAIGESQKEEGEKDQITCGCYMIDPAVINDCGDPKRAFLFTTKTVASDQVCNAQCDTESLSKYVLKSSTSEDRFKSCSIRSISDARCESMILTDQDGKLITGKIAPEDEINVEATFDKDTYKDYTFKVNTQTEEPDSLEGNKIAKKLANFEGVNSIEIVATATDSQGDSINSIICRRVVEIEQEGGVGTNAITASTERQSDGTTKISQVIISVGQLTSENVDVKFSFGTQFQSLTTQSGLTVESAKGSITMSKANLYDSTNFIDGQSFNILNSHEGDLTITAEVFVDDVSIGVASTEVEFADIVVPAEETPGQDEQPDGEEIPTEGEDTDPLDQESNFAAAKAVTPACVERVEGKDEATFTITIRNNATVDQAITSIKDKLPLGFTYVTGSSVVNGTAVEDSPLVAVTAIGSTQEIVWTPATPWNVTAGALLTISFKSMAGSSALTGDNLNEIIVNPVQIPTDPSTLRAQATVVVAQDCNNIPDTTTPSTGILDNLFVRLALGVVLFITAWAVYTRPEGSKLSEIIIDSGMYKGAEMTKYRFTNPKKYFEEKILREKK